MKKFTDIIKEQESQKEYKWTANVNVGGTVIASSEGEAGELVDKEMDEIKGMIDYQIINIGESDETVIEKFKKANKTSKIDESSLSSETIERMEGLANIEDLKKFNELLSSLTKEWLNEGFDREDIMNYVSDKIMFNVNESVSDDRIKKKITFLENKIKEEQGQGYVIADSFKDLKELLSLKFHNIIRFELETMYGKETGRLFLYTINDYYGKIQSYLKKEFKIDSKTSTFFDGGHLGLAIDGNVHM